MHSRRLGGVRTWLTVVVALAAAAPGMGGVPSPFTEEAMARGLDYTMSPYPQAQGYVGQGAGFVDLDSDGDPDVVLIGRADGVIGIFENTGGGMFFDRTASSGIPVMQEQEGLAAADYDADGYLDIYITQANNRPNFLMKNDGDFTFTNVSLIAGVSAGALHTTGPNWGDYDEDGWLDLYVCNYGTANILFHNNGAVGNFSNLAGALGVTGGSALSFETAWTDFDRDGDVDLYLSNDRADIGYPPNMLWRNDDGVFVDVSVGSGADLAIYSMGVGSGDVDNNLYPDLYMTNIFTYNSNGDDVQYDGVNPLLLNQGDDTFVDQTELWETANRHSSWAAIFFDWDNDGYKDLYVNNQFTPNSFFHCTGAPPCTEMANQLGIESAFDPDYDLLTDPPDKASYSSAVADVDGDGDLDLLVNNLGYRAELFINNEGDERDYVRLDIVGEYPNLFAIGGNVEVTAGGKTQFYEIHAGGNGYLGQNELIVHVGLGTAETVDQALVHWPSAGPDRTLTGLPANHTWKIYPPSRLCDTDGDGVDYTDFLDFSACFAAGFSAGCEMMDFDGDSHISSDDIEDCYVTAASDCNGNGTEDVAEIMLDPGLDADQNYAIDCCENGTADDPNEVGDSLRLDKNGSFDPVLSWTAPGVDATHGAATAYDLFAAGSFTGPFVLLASVGTTSHTDAAGSPGDSYYLVGARNGCGTSGEEPF